MKISAIITEYNPLHNGHIYHIKKTKEICNSDALVCVMSGNFVQRGIPAIIDKWIRTKMALLNGVDLVIELPSMYSLSSAEFFAFGAVSLLNNLGVIDNLCFGSEIGDVKFLTQVAKIFNNEPKEFNNILRKYIDEGNVYPSARSKALIDYLSSGQTFDFNRDLSHIDFNSALNSSNNILGIEYIKSLEKLSSSIVPYTIKRQGSLYNDISLNNQYSSATSIRKHLRENGDPHLLKGHIPDSVFNIISNLKLSGYTFTYQDTMLPYLKYKAITNEQSLLNLPDASEGIHNKIIGSLINGDNLIDIIENIKSKRYTYTRINRILCQYFIGFDQFNTVLMRDSEAPYARILGFNSVGQKVLKKMKSNSSIPIYTKLPKTVEGCLTLDLLSTKAYSLLNKNIKWNSDYLTSPIILKS